ncbi:SsgA family sporulation/cell division regulator [Streptomyces krungchingensis]
MTHFDTTRPHLPRRLRRRVGLVLERTANAFLVCSEDVLVPFTIRLVYDSADPYAAQIHFPGLDKQRRATIWFLARSLLEEGQRVLTGEGDALVIPCGEGWTGLELRGTTGSTTVLIAGTTLQDFIAATYQTVPAGHEHHLIGLDEGLADLLDEVC